jgi:hypothetical protein
VPVSIEGQDVSQAGAAGNADLGGSSKYSGEQPGAVRLGQGFHVNSD